LSVKFFKTFLSLYPYRMDISKVNDEEI